MKRSIALLIAASMLVGSQSLAEGDKTPAKQLKFTVRMCEGDIPGSREAGSFKVFAAPSMVTLENQSVSLQVGGEAPAAFGDSVRFVTFGLTIQATPGAVKDAKVPLDITLTKSALGKQTDELVQVHGETTRAITTVRLGEVTWFRLGKGNSDKQIWAELRVDEVERPSRK